MARFYGTIQGARGPASRLGSTKSGLTVTAQTWGESFTVRLWAGDAHTTTKDRDTRDYGSVHLGGFCLFHGDTDMLKSREGRIDWIVSLIMNTRLRSDIMQELAKRGLKEKFDEHHT